MIIRTQRFECSQAGSLNSGGGGGGGTVTGVEDQSGTITTSAVVQFLVDGTTGISTIANDGPTPNTLTYSFAGDANHNLGLGTSWTTAGGIGYNLSVGVGGASNGPLQSITSGSINVAIGSGSPAALFNLTTGDRNFALGASCMANATSDSYNVGIGYAALSSLNGSTGYNIAIGDQAGNTYTTGGSNISINSFGGGGTESNTLRIGQATGAGGQDLAAAYICGISGVNVGSTAQVVTMGTGGTADKLGTAVLTAGSGVSITPGANAITIAATGSGITTINGNSGSVTGSTVTIQTSNSTIKTSGSGTTMTMNMQGDANNNTLIGTSGSSLSSGARNITLGVNAGQNLTSGTNNIAIGYNAMQQSSITGSNNVGIGYDSCYALTSGAGNCALGTLSLGNVTSGSNNIALGASALQNATTDQYNTAVGASAARSLNGGSGQNTLIGNSSGYQITTGSYNTFLGGNTGTSYTSSESSNIILGYNTIGTAAESHVLRIGAGTGTSNGYLNSAYICGIQGITVTGAAVLVSASDQLGVAVSSRKFKDNIEDMGSLSEDIYKLRPTKFTYKGSTETRYGLIAEEVADVMPSLVVYDKSGAPQTVMYHELPALLLNEIQKLRKEIDELKGK